MVLTEVRTIHSYVAFQRNRVKVYFFNQVGTLQELFQRFFLFGLSSMRSISADAVIHRIEGLLWNLQIAT
ncbi:hypothetical protein SAMN04487967_0399 [Natronorubrum sediminis]|uniref:Uncharacterized protein n=1 Tax=Natronorubrum sediminis TaxID=640943 RepID=A0A1H6FL04_9EURY|nr:hypothetical protein SAMN04487967_0399 [Natronorubrum sediminis]